MSITPIDLSIIIVNYKTEDLIIDCLLSVYEHTKDVSMEILVVDNAYQKEGEDKVKSIFKDVRWIDMRYNAGFSRANNAGIKEAKGEYILLLNADTLMIDNAIGKAISRLKERPDIAAIGGLQLYKDLSEMPYYHTINDIRKTFYILPDKPFFNNLIEKLLPKTNFSDPNETNNLVGAFVITPKKVIEKVGMLDEDFFMYGEDLEWAGRLNKAGKLCYFEDIKFVHLVNESPFRRTQISFVNRFSTQMQVSNLLWIRKEFGVLAYLILILNYTLLVPLFWIAKILSNIRYHGKVFYQLESQKLFTLKVGVLLKYCWKTLLNKPYFYQIKPTENIDKMYQ
jgi:GT2 family glycosyltransferase